MKKIISFLTVAILLVTLSFGTLNVSALSGSASLSGPKTVRAGDTIKLSFSISGSGLLGAEGSISYNSSQLTLASTKQVIGGSWVVEFNGNTFVAYDNDQTSPINSSKTLFELTFKVKAIEEGSQIKVSCSSDISDGRSDKRVDATYSATIAAPLSTNNNLASLTVSNATITPSFSTDVTSYKADVGFDVSKLQVTASAEDSKAKVTVDNPNLRADATTKVTVTVTAENGSKKTYTISVKRAGDPNYVASGNNNLKSITVDGFLLSPVFKSDVTRYVVWLPYETESITVKGVAADNKASVETVGGSGLLAGQDNEIKVICTAENGNKKEYIVVAKRAAGHDGSVDEMPEEDPEEQKPQGSDTSNLETSTPNDAETDEKGQQDDGNGSDTTESPRSLYLTVLFSVLGGFAAGFVCCIIVDKLRKKN